jgi:hypothetical protein
MYITPRVLIQQEFKQIPVYAEFPLPAFIIGPHYSLNRYSEASEKSSTVLNSLDGVVYDNNNAYNPLEDTRYSFSNVPAGGDVDHSYTKVFAENVEAKYFPNEDLGSDDVANVDSLSFVLAPNGSKYPNKVRFTNVTLKSEGDYNRSSYFSARDVAVNDTIKITDNLGNVFVARISDLVREDSSIDSDLSATIAEVIYNGNNGSTNGTSIFTANDVGVSFVASQVVGKYLTLNVPGSSTGYKILACPTSNTLILDRVVATSTGKTWSIGGTYNDVKNSIQRTTNYSSATVTANNFPSANSTVEVSNTSTNYVGYNSLGVLSDTYTVTVTKSGSVSDAEFSISSANGVFTTKLGQKLVDGTLTIDDDGVGGNEVYFEFTEAEEGTDIAFVKGNAWSCSLQATVSPVTPVVDGDAVYIGVSDVIYTIRVDKGGPFYDGTNSATCARLSISSSDVDSSSVVLPQENTLFNVGTRGVSVKFSTGTNNDGLILGDTYYVPATAEKLGAYTIVELSESLPSATLSAASTITGELFLNQKSVQIAEIRDLLENTTNWEQEDSYITIKSGLTTFVPTLLNVSTGAPARLVITSANLYAEHRDLLQTYVNAIDSLRSLVDVEKKLGKVHPDNPLALGVYDAVLNSANMIVYFIAVETNDLSGYTKAIKISEKSDKVYSFVPLTFDRTIQDAVVSHVNAYSTPEVGRWRIAWLAAQDIKSEVLYSLKEDGSDYTATITDDTTVIGTQNRLVTIEGAKFIDDGIRPNDTIRINFRLSAAGKVIYDEYTVDKVRTNTTLVIINSLSAPINSAIKVEVARNYTKSERANLIALRGGEYNNRRVRMVFPDTYVGGGFVKQGYFAAAGLAGLRSGVVPHQGLTNTEFLGAYDLSKVVVEFSSDELNTMAEQGIWIISQEVVGATAYVRHQLTTDESGLNTSEDSITTNVDNISYRLKHALSPFIGKYNVNEYNLLVIRENLIGLLYELASNTFTIRAGNQLTSFTPDTDLLKLQQNPVSKDKIDIEVRLNVPYPLNYINLKLIV